MHPALSLIIGLVGLFALVALPLALRDLFTTWRDTRRLRRALQEVPGLLVMGYAGFFPRYLVVQYGRRELHLRAVRVGPGVTTAGMEIRQPLGNSLRELKGPVARRFRALSESVTIGDFGGNHLAVSWPQTQEVAARLTWAAALRDAVDLGSPWAVCAQELGLRVGDDADVIGELHGVPVGARLDDQGRCQLRAAGRSSFRAVHKDHELWDAEPTGNLVVDQLLKVSGARAELFDDTELVEPLLAVVHGYPGSRVHPDGATLVLSALKLDIREEFEKLVALIRALESAAPAEQDQAEQAE